jgi:hypothetical protein
MDSLYEELIKQVGNRRVPPGSAVLSFSAAHLANVGLEQYTRDLITFEEKLLAKFGRETIFQPLPAILLGGTDNQDLIRSMLELSAWINIYYVGDNFLEESVLRAKCILLELGEKEQQHIPSRRYSLPMKESSKATRVWASEGEDGAAMPRTIKALTTSMEISYVQGLVKEIRAKMAIDLDSNPAVERTMGVQEHPKRKVEILLIGGHNTTSVATELRARGKTVDVISWPEWTISRGRGEAVQRHAGDHPRRGSGSGHYSSHGQQHILCKEGGRQQTASGCERGWHRSPGWGAPSVR